MGAANSPSNQPWASGPAEILQHGIDLLEKDDDAGRRLAMLSIDNSVELMIKTYLGLPSRITKLHITKKEFEEASHSVPALLAALEKHCPDKIVEISLGEIEWFHRLRNLLYHEGNGITVERQKVVAYSAVAQTLFSRLFGVSLPVRAIDGDYTAEFLQAWSRLEYAIWNLGMDWSATGEVDGFNNWGEAFDHLADHGVIPDELAKQVERTRKMRNAVVHQGEPVRRTDVEQLRVLRDKIEDLPDEP